MSPRTGLPVHDIPHIVMGACQSQQVKDPLCNRCVASMALHSAAASKRMLPKREAWQRMVFHEANRLDWLLTHLAWQQGPAAADHSLPKSALE